MKTVLLMKLLLLVQDFITGDGSGPGQLSGLVIQDDGKILVSGYFSEYDGDSIGYGIARLNTDGSLDNTFDVGGGFDSGVQKIVIQDDGKIIVGGSLLNTTVIQLAIALFDSMKTVLLMKLCYWYRIRYYW